MLIAVFSPMYYMKFFDKLDNYPIFSGLLLGLIMLIQASFFVLLYNYFYLYHSSTVTENWKTIIDSLENVPGNTDNFRNLSEKTFKVAKSQLICDNLKKWKAHITEDHFDIISQQLKINIVVLSHSQSIKYFKHPDSQWNIIFYIKNENNYRVGIQMPMKNNLFHFKNLPRDIQFLTEKRKTKKIMPKV